MDEYKLFYGEELIGESKDIVKLVSPFLTGEHIYRLILQWCHENKFSPTRRYAVTAVFLEEMAKDNGKPKSEKEALINRIFLSIHDALEEGAPGVRDIEALLRCLENVERTIIKKERDRKDNDKDNDIEQS